MPKLDRRTFLQAAGLAGGALMFPSLGRATPPTARPRRIVFIMTELGWNPFDFRMSPAGAPADLLIRSAYHPAWRDIPDERTWEIDLTRTPQADFSPTLEPLYGFRDRMLALDGLGMVSIGADGLGDGHARGWNNALCGHPAGTYLTSQRALAGAPSIDMRIARHLRANNAQLTDLAAQHFIVNVWGSDGSDDPFHHYFYDYGPSGEIIRVPLSGDPGVVFDTMFPGGASMGTDAMGTGRRSMLDMLSERYAAVFPNLSSEDRQKLQLHQQFISDLENRLSILDGTTCASPSRPSAATYQEIMASPENAYESHLESFLDLTTIAFSCDLTRVVSMQLENSGNVLGPLYGAGDSDFHEWYSHGTNPPVRWYGDPDANVTQEEYDRWLDAAPVISNKNRYHAEVVARLATKLDAIPDGDGTLLDNTLIVLMDEISHGSHGHDQWPVVMVGGFGGAFRMGRYIRFPRANPRPSINAMGDFVGVPHSHLLVSMCQAMGLPLNDLGLESVYGRAPGFAGSRISLTGPLDALT